MEIINTVKFVEQSIEGRIANRVGDRRTNGIEMLLRYVTFAGDGNYLEIGTLFGGSAISVALWKQKTNQQGFVFCIDPLDGYYKKYSPRRDMVDLQSGIPVTPETLFYNLEKFDVAERIFVMKAYSTEVMSLWGLKFSVAYIDGDHRDDVPLGDWLLVKNYVTDYVVFDNHSETHPAVMDACRIAADDPEWKEVYNDDITYVVKRVS